MSRAVVWALTWAALCATCTAYKRVGERKLFYIYDFPTVPLDMYPNRSIKLGERTVKERGKLVSVPSVWKHDFNENEGFGKVHNGTMLLETWQYSSFRLVLARLMRSKYRTRNISEAEMFFIPWDSGAESYVDEFGSYRNVGNPTGDYLLNELRREQTFYQNHGYDHFLVHSTSLVAHKVGVKLREILLFGGNITVATVERLPFLHGWIAHLPFIQPIPMPSVYHWRVSEGPVSLPVLNLLRKNEIFISFFGSPNTMMRNANKLRARLFSQCDKANAAAAAGQQLYSKVKERYGSVCVTSSFIGGQLERNSVGVLDVMAAYEKSVYCLCPFGDTPIRRAIFDAVLAGCIPVLFRTKFAMYPIDQYNWHLSKQEIDDAFEFVDVAEYREMMSWNYIDRLVSNYVECEVLKKQKALAALAHKIQYSMPPDVRQFSMPSVAEDLPVWDPLVPDAVDLLLERMGKRVDRHVLGYKKEHTVH